MTTQNLPPLSESVPAGRYQGRARGQISTTNNKSNDGLRVAVTIDLLNEGYEDKRVVWFGTLGVSPEADTITVRQLRDMGWSAAVLDEASGLGDAEVAVVVKYEEYQGKEQQKVDVWPLGGSTFAFETAAEPGLKKSVEARLKGLFASTVPKRRPATGPAPAWKAPGPAAAPKPATRTPTSSGGWDGQGADPNPPSAVDDGIPF